ncbi:siroheme synthase CysG [Oceanibaculum pacificum]|uniref:Uncharacterized protein n=1 Tax=Oceanibaculum pacificum TaxID=580166 RepID=A0A154W1H2_9PROT|nr:siroheme synthase CysG [Oceanibaculum pacificum]KZD07404.1 hypothetical protein AUP43_02470 [Oceanibaculum pacificum]
MQLDATFPVFHLVSGRKVLFVGGGDACLRKLRLFAGKGCRPVVVAPVIDPAVAALVEADGGALYHRVFAPKDLDGAALVFAGSADESELQAVSAAARRAGVPVNVPDRPQLSSFIMPAIIDRAPITVAVSSAGASPVLARRIKSRIESLLPASLGRFAQFLQRFREAAKQELTDFEQRRRLQESLAEGRVAELFLSGDEPAAEAAAQAALRGATSAVSEGSVVLIGAGPGDPDLLTLRAVRALQEAEVIVHDKLVDPRVLDYARRDARRVYVGKSRASHTCSQAQINEILIAEARAGHRVARVKGGDPYVFGRGAEEIAALRDAGIRTEVVPGLTAALGCGAAAGIPLTHRDLASGVTILSGHGLKGEPALDWSALARLNHTLVIYMGLANLAFLSARLIEGGLSRATPAAIIENGTRPDQRIVAGTLSDLPALATARGLTGPALIMVGDVVALSDALPEAARKRLVPLRFAS